MTTSWRETLEQIRAQAARNCGLDHYPAEAIRKAEDNPTVRYERMQWRNYLTRIDKKARTP